ncbi:MAG: hypothetical protein WC356_02805 [Candidatus Micrarchaeia archaeon]|jgi:hypothetical protein
MKKVIFAAIMGLAGICFAETTTDYREDNGRLLIYYHCSSVAPVDFNDSNTVSTAKKIYSNFSGEILDVLIDPNGTDADSQIIIYADLKELGETQIKKLYPVKVFSIVATAVTGTAIETGFYFGVATVNDPDSNVFGGFSLAGCDLYIGRQNMATLMDDIKVYVNARVK